MDPDKGRARRRPYDARVPSFIALKLQTLRRRRVLIPLVLFSVTAFFWISSIWLQFSFGTGGNYGGFIENGRLCLFREPVPFPGSPFYVTTTLFRTIYWLPDYVMPETMSDYKTEICGVRLPLWPAVFGLFALIVWRFGKEPSRSEVVCAH